MLLLNLCHTVSSEIYCHLSLSVQWTGWITGFLNSCPVDVHVDTFVLRKASLMIFLWISAQFIWYIASMSFQGRLTEHSSPWMSALRPLLEAAFCGHGITFWRLGNYKWHMSNGGNEVGARGTRTHSTMRKEIRMSITGVSLLPKYARTLVCIACVKIYPH